MSSQVSSLQETMQSQPGAPLIVPRLRREAAAKLRDARRSCRPATKLADGRKFKPAGGGMRAHRALRAVEHHGGTRSRAATFNVRAKSPGFFVSPGAMTRAERHVDHLLRESIDLQSVNRKK
jgi:hypothetical protein